ncbi:response regulator [Bacillus sp. PS06]|nr:response regulator [Bacillus sp. PS06]
MKVMIVDDELQIRKGLKMKINWEDQGYSICAEASNGKEALNILEEHNIDVILTDIRMPLMNGIEFFIECQKKHPCSRIIVLSGYSEFEYVRSAIQAGVKDYLLKPVVRNELIETLSRLRIEIKKEKSEFSENARIRNERQKLLQGLQEQYLLQLVKEDWSEISPVIERLDQLQLSDLTEENIHFQLITVEIREPGKDDMKLNELRLPFQTICKEIAGTNNAYCFHNPSYSNMIHFLIYSQLSDKLKTKELVKEIQRNVTRYLKLVTIVGLGNVVRGLPEIKNAYISSLLSWSNSDIGSYDQVIEGDFHKEMIEFSPEIERKLINAIEKIEFESFKLNVESILEKHKKYSIGSFTFLANRIFLLLMSLVIKYGIETSKIQQELWLCQQSILEHDSQAKVLDKLMSLAQNVIQEVKGLRASDGSHIVEGVRRFLEKNYANDITLTSLSKQFHLNGTYLSELFKNQVGQTYSDYLIKLRINKARELLLDSELKIIDVAQLVGFSNSSYFGTVFKKYVGQTPVEYRKEKICI